MDKLFISVPMRGRTDDFIKNSFDNMHKLAEIAFGKELEIIQTHISPNNPEGTNTSVWCLGRSIQKLAEADYYIGIQDNWLKAKDEYHGCEIENYVVKSYDIKSFLIEPEDYEFFKDIRFT